MIHSKPVDIWGTFKIFVIVPLKNLLLFSPRVIQKFLKRNVFNLFVFLGDCKSSQKYQNRPPAVFYTYCIQQQSNGDRKSSFAILWFTFSIAHRAKSILFLRLLKLIKKKSKDNNNDHRLSRQIGLIPTMHRRKKKPGSLRIKLYIGHIH